MRYTYRRSGFEQDVILQEAIILPPAFNPATIRLEIWTEFVRSPQPGRTVRITDGMESEAIDFGSMRIGAGKAFAAESGAEGPTIPVASQWLPINGRMFLVEAVRFQAMEQEMARLGGQTAMKANPPVQMAQGAAPRPFPKARLARAKRPSDKIQMFEYSFDDIGNWKMAASGGDQWGANLRYQNYTPNSLNQYSQRTVPGFVDARGMGLSEWGCQNGDPIVVTWNSAWAPRWRSLGLALPFCEIPAPRPF